MAVARLGQHGKIQAEEMWVVCAKPDFHRWPQRAGAPLQGDGAGADRLGIISGVVLMALVSGSFK